MLVTKPLLTSVIILVLKRTLPRPSFLSTGSSYFKLFLIDLRISNNLRDKFSPGPGFEPASLGLHAGMLTDCTAQTNHWAKPETLLLVDYLDHGHYGNFPLKERSP